MDELVRWLGEQLDKDERTAREAGGLAWSRPEDPGDPAAIRDSERERVVYDEGWPSEGQAVHIAEWDPARVLREIDAKRQTIREYEKAIRKRGEHTPSTPAYRHWDNRSHGLFLALRFAAAVYVDRPGYAEAIASVQ